MGERKQSRTKKAAGNRGRNAVPTVTLSVRKTAPAKLKTPITDARSLTLAILNLLPDIIDIDREIFSAFYLNASKQIVECSRLHVGGTSISIVDKKIFLLPAIETGASYAITVHNHPGGYLLPSKTDIETFHTLEHAAQTYDVTITDHAIVITRGVFSCRERKFVPFARLKMQS